MRNEKGQSTVEYVLLLGVLITISITVFKSSIFQDLFGPNSEVFQRIRRTLEYSYRHGINGESGNAEYNGGEHDTYFKGGQTRFFTPTDAYER